jgi:hypothetical protein
MTTPSESPLQRYVPLACWVIAILSALLICLKIISYGYLPGGDARRHVARVFSDKPFRDIVVMKPFYVVDHSAGWERLLRVVQHVTGSSEDGLMSFSVAAFFALLLCAPLFFLRRPEAWLAAVMAQVIAIPELPARWTQGRPFLLTEAILICLLLAWSRESARQPSRRLILGSFIAFTLSVWMHGAWYLWLLLPVAFCFAQRWSAAFWLTICWLAGAVAGSLLTGHPIAFLKEQLMIVQSIRAERLPSRLLVGEMRPHDGEFASVAMLAAVYLWGRVRKIDVPPVATQPAFWLLLIGWTLGFLGDRFWADWGLPAGLVWMALQFDEIMLGLWSDLAGFRALACAAIALPLLLDSTNNLGERYTASLREWFVDGSAPELQGWMPDSGGIFYSAQMQFFYNTFYVNPRGDWRYILGFEPALMPDDDLKTLRQIQSSGFSADAYEPWLKKMRPIDRLEIDSQEQPNIPALEWKRAIGYVWIGRLPHSIVAPKQKS